MNLCIILSYSNVFHTIVKPRKDVNCYYKLEEDTVLQSVEYRIARLLYSLTYILSYILANNFSIASDISNYLYR